ncbi:MAG: hypothetical protein KDC98_08360 [Planctomycetes bacterium]|nr:hypothetical protein [Planctomycetota bacterium]
MNVPTVLASVLLAAGAAVVVTTFTSSAVELPPPDSGMAAQEAAALRSEIAELRQQLAAIAATPSQASVGHERVAVPSLSNEPVAVAVEAYLRQRASDGGAGQDASPVETEELEAVFARLTGTNFWENSDRWKEVLAAGRMDEVIERFEAEAKAFPNDPEKQMALANAYLAYVQMDQSKYQFSIKADETFDKVLALDERHWGARFSKAVSYTFWPEFLGKRKEAISHFETLVEQQESMPVQGPDYQTYLFLGNLLEGSEPERARGIWQRGLDRHPSNKELLELGR